MGVRFPPCPSIRMDIEELKKRLSEFSRLEIEITRHAHKRIQDRKRGINYSWIMSLIMGQKGFYYFKEQKAKNRGELKFKLWFKLNWMYDMNVYVVMNKEKKKKGLNRLKIVSAHKVRRRIQEEINKNGRKD